MYKRLTKATTAAVLTFVLLTAGCAAAQGQDIGTYRGRQGRRVGRVTLPTPPFNPDAGILNKRKGRKAGPTKAAMRRPTRRNTRAANRKAAARKARQRLSKRQ